MPMVVLKSSGTHYYNIAYKSNNHTAKSAAVTEQWNAEDNGAVCDELGRIWLWIRLGLTSNARYIL